MADAQNTSPPAQKGFAAGYGFTAALAPDLPNDAEIAEVVRLAKLSCLANSESELVAQHQLKAFKPGGEHTVYGHPDGNVVKIAKFGTGMGFVLNQGATPEADRIGITYSKPHEYLKRLSRANDIFDDGSRILGYVPNDAGAPMFVHDQKFAGNHDATQGQIEQYMHEDGFRRLAPEVLADNTNALRDATFYNEKTNVLVADCWPRNFRVDDIGKVTPIDLIITKPEGRMLELCRTRQIMLATDKSKFDGVDAAADKFVDQVRALHKEQNPLGALEKLVAGMEGGEASKKQLCAAGQMHLLGAENSEMIRHVARMHFQNAAIRKGAETGVSQKKPPGGRG